LELWTCFESCGVSCELHSISWTSSSPVPIVFVGNLCSIWTCLVIYRRPTAESWESVETFFFFLASSLGIEMFMNEKGKVVTELGDEM